MNPRAPRLLLAVLSALTAAAGAALVADAAAARGRADRAGEFQAVVGGLGFGPATDLSRCAFSFDPRLCPGCPQDLGPVPGGARFCPYHGCSILYYPRLEPEVRGDPGGHAPRP
jgi:hypothetical protein